ncbi:flagellar hook-length control protein FliK [Luteimonas sp. FCS-9]|uniref:flagellar hook-length control protein FliK n=1 Tax=Luteimonas sp. FCS-9 TaxID=1547516 RepID=UPI00069AC2AB|nr:flagellar hook-length control protein FliK [Luteimonas sp. FCS-9]
MTPLASTAQAGTVPMPRTTRGAASEGARGDDGFARALEHRQAQRSADGAAQRRDARPPADEAPAADADGPTSHEAASAQDDPDPATAAAGAALPPVVPAPWPPTGLAGLVGFSPAPELPAEATPASEAPLPPPTAAASPVAATGIAMPASLPPPDAVPPGDAMLAVDAAADAVPASPGDPVADAGEPAPIAFALPGAPAPAARAPAPLLASPLPPPDVHGGDFEDRLGAQLEWMAGQKIGHARIRVTPQDLGPIEVRLQLDGDRIAADFVSPHAQTRDALEQGLPRLRDLLGEHGFQLAHAGVGHDGGADARDGMSSPSGRSDRDIDPHAGAEPTPAPAIAPTRIGLLDAYA